MSFAKKYLDVCKVGERCPKPLGCEEGTIKENGVCKSAPPQGYEHDYDYYSGVSSGDSSRGSYPSNTSNANGKYIYKNGIKHDPNCSSLRQSGSMKMNGMSYCSGICTQESRNYYSNRSRKL